MLSDQAEAVQASLQSFQPEEQEGEDNNLHPNERPEEQGQEQHQGQSPDIFPVHTQKKKLLEPA